MCTEAQGQQLINNGDAALVHHKRAADYLQDIADDIRLIRHALCDEPETWAQTVTQSYPFPIDRRGRKYLYILSPTTFTFNAPTQSGDAPLTVTQGVFTILPFHTGEYLTAPAVVTPINALLIAQNEVIR